MRSRLRRWFWFALVPFEAAVLWVAFLFARPFRLTLGQAWDAALESAKMRAKERRDA